MPPAAPARGRFQTDGFGDEYAWGVWQGFDFGGVEEGGGGDIVFERTRLFDKMVSLLWL